MNSKKGTFVLNIIFCYFCCKNKLFLSQICGNGIFLRNLTYFLLLSTHSVIRKYSTQSIVKYFILSESKHKGVKRHRPFKASILSELEENCKLADLTIAVVQLRTPTIISRPRSQNHE